MNDGTIIGLRGANVYVCRGSSGNGCPGVRGDITGYSERSGRRLRQYLAASEAEYRVAATLTIPSWHRGADDPIQAKTWLKAWVERYRRRFWPKRDLGLPSLLWVMERQACRSIHFHLASTHAIPHQWLADSWYEVVGTQDERHRRAGTEVRTIRKCVETYLAKYLTKDAVAEQGRLDAQRTGRWWGIVGRRDTVEATLRLQGTPDEGENPASERVLADFEQVISQEVAAGRAREVEMVRDGAPIPGLKVWHVPSKGWRRIWRARMRAWKVEAAGVWTDEDIGADVAEWFP